MRSITSRTSALFLVVVSFGALAAGCGGSDDGGDSSASSADLASGRKLFQQSCRSCHSLADANAAGTFGPNLDDLQPDAETVRRQIDSGGGGMPPNLLEGKDADTVAKYVAEVAGSEPDGGGDSGSSSTGSADSGSDDSDDGTDATSSTTTSSDDTEDSEDSEDSGSTTTTTTAEGEGAGADDSGGSSSSGSKSSGSK